MTRTTDGRGFTIYDQFTDTYGKQVTIQESSHADGDRCWIFSTGGAPHLNPEQARRVRDALDAFIADQPWQAPDGTRWIRDPGQREWTGWQPGEDGTWTLTEDEFTLSYPEAPR